MQVFVSFTGKDREIKNQVVERLRQELDSGDTVWESDEGCMSDYSEESIREIRQSEVYVILLSANSMDEASYVFNELIEARQREMRGNLDMMIFKLDDAPLTERFSLQLNHISDANHTGRLYHNTDMGLESLVKKVRYLLQCRKLGKPEKPFDVFMPELNGVPLGRGGYYVPHSRDALLMELEDALSRSNIVFSFQLPGFGRRTTVYKYAEWRQDQFEHIILFPQFSGSVRDFFLAFLTIRNINDSIYEKMSDQEVIRKKVELLNKLGPKTLLIVPNLTPGKEDDTDLFRLFSDLECKLVFVTQSVPRRLQDSYPVVNVGRMDDEYLFTLFFHYYDLGDDAERKELEPSLQSFFQSIGGHTKTVEIAANILEDDYVFPEDVPALIQKIGTFEDDELGDRIYSMVSELFDLKRFDEADQKILLTAALIANIGIPEREFVQVLKDAGVFDGRRLNRMIELCWIDRDRDTEDKVLSMSAILCSVCTAKIPMDEDILDACVKCVSDELVPVMLSGDPKGRFYFFRSMQRLWELQGYSACVMLTELTIRVLSDGDYNIESGKLAEMIKDALSEVESMSESVRDNSDSVVHTMIPVLQLNSAINGLSARTGNVAFDDAVFSTILSSSGFRESLEGLSEYMDDELSGISEALRSLVVCRTIHEAVPIYLHIIDQVFQILEAEEDNEGAEMLAMLLNNLGARLSELLSNAPFVRLQVLQSRERLLGYMVLCPPTEYYRLEKDMLETLAFLAEDPDEITCAYDDALDTLEEFGEQIFAKEHELEEGLIDLHRTYIHAMIDVELPEVAETACRDSWKVPVRTAATFQLQTDSIAKVCNALLAAGNMEDALKFLEDALPYARSIFSREFMQDQAAAEARDEMEAMGEILQVLKNPDQNNGFTDCAGEFLDYYKTYGSGNGNRGSMKKYSAIADQTMKLDYTGYSEEELRETKEKLTRQAAAGKKWEDLAPEAFALVSEAGNRVLGYHLHYVQIVGAAAVFDGNAAEMLNGEGKTFTIAASAFLHVLFKRQVHILDPSIYLCRRNFIWMRSLYELLGVSSGIIDHDQNLSEELASLSEMDVLYGFINEMVFIYLRQERGEEEFSRYPLRRDVAIVDEGDQVFMNGAAMVQIIDRDYSNSNKKYYELAYDLISGIDPEENPEDNNYFVCKDRQVTLRPPLYSRAEQRLGKSLADLSPVEVNTLEDAFRTAVITLHVYKKDKDYFLGKDKNGLQAIMYENDKGELVPVAENWAYFLWRKEGRNLESYLVNLNKKRLCTAISFYSFLKTYTILSGASATFSSLKEGLRDYYRLPVFFVPPNLPIIRRDEPALVYLRQEYKYQAIADLVTEKYKTGQPVLLICQNVSESQMVSSLLTKAGVEHTLFNAVNADQDPDRLLYAGEPGRVTVTTAIANRGVDICLGGNPSAYAKADLIREGIAPEKLDDAISAVSEADPDLAVLRKRYAFLCALYWRRFSEKKEMVEKLGGLCVIGTTCFDDLRTEQQMRGRAGRQGSPGESHVFYSFDDDQFRRLLGDRYQLFLRMMQDVDEGINSSMLDRAILRARMKIQSSHFLRPDQTPDALYYTQARKRLLSVIADVRRPGFDFPAFWTKQFDSDPRYKKDLETYGKNGVIRVSSFTGKLIYYGGLQAEDIPKRFQPKFLMDCFMRLLMKKPEKLSEYLGKTAEWLTVSEMQKAWSSYLENMEKEVAGINRLISQEGKRKKHLEEFSSRESRRQYDDAVERVLIMISRNAALDDTENPGKKI